MKYPLAVSFEGLSFLGPVIGSDAMAVLFTCMYQGLNHPVGQVYQYKIGWLCAVHRDAYEREIQRN